MLQEKFDIKVTKVIYHGLLDMFRTRVPKEPSKKQVILWNSRLVPIKEPHVFVEAMARIRSKIDFRVIFRADGPLRGMLERELEKRKLMSNVTFAEPMPFEKIPSLYRSATLLVHTSSNEPFGFAILEAMGAGVPVIVPRKGGAYEVAGEGALSYEPHNPIDLADKIVSIVSDPNLYRKQAKRSFERAQNFRWDKAAEEYLRIYQKLHL